MDQPPVQRKIVRFQSDGDEIEAIVCSTPGRTEPKGAVVMGGGWCYVKEFVTPVQMYAEAFARAGLVALAFDYRGFGGSGGALRQHVDPWMQIEDYQNAISYVQSRPDVDAERIGVWGISYSGGHVLILSALDDRVRANVGIVPVVDGRLNLRMAHGTLGYRRLAQFVAEERRSRFQTQEHRYIPMNSLDPQAIATWPFTASVDMFEWLSQAPGAGRYENRQTVASVEKLMAYSVYPYVTRIVDVPTMMVIAEKDDHTFWEFEVDAFNAIPTSKKTLRVIEGRGMGHHSIYRQPDVVAQVAAECAEWFVRWL